MRAVVGLVISVLLLANADGVRAMDNVFYGQLNLGFAAVDTGAPDLALGLDSYDSRLGVRGFHELSGVGRAVWTLEAGLDISGERESLSGGQRFAGLEHSFGQLVAGVLESPVKTLRQRLSLFNNSIGDSHNLLGTSVSGIHYTDYLVRNAVQYQSPRIAGMISGRWLYSFGNHDQQTTTGAGDARNLDLTALGLDLNAGPYQAGLAWQRGPVSPPAGVVTFDLRVLRLGGAWRHAQGRAAVLYETISAGTGATMSRDAAMINYQHHLDNYRLGLQLARVASHDGSTATGADSLSIGVEYHWSIDSRIYLLFTGTRNDRQARFGSAPQGPGSDAWLASALGQATRGIGAGVWLRF